MSERDSTSESSGSHPLVSLLFWLSGNKLQENEEPNREKEKKQQVEEDFVSNERPPRRSLSWKDEHPNELLETWHEFGDVKGPDMKLSSGNDADQDGKPSSMKAGTKLSRKPSTLGDEDSEEDKKRYSPNSPNWGFFVSITPPTDVYTNEVTKRAPTDQAADSSNK